MNLRRSVEMVACPDSSLESFLESFGKECRGAYTPAYAAYTIGSISRSIGLENGVLRRFAASAGRRAGQKV